MVAVEVQDHDPTDFATLPVYPPLLVRIFAGIQAGRLRQTPQLVRQCLGADPVLLARALSAEGGLPLGEHAEGTVDELAAVVAPDRFRMLVTLAGVQQFFSPFNQGAAFIFEGRWRRARWRAEIAHRLAVQCGYSVPGQARLGALLWELVELEQALRDDGSQPEASRDRWDSDLIDKWAKMACESWALPFPVVETLRLAGATAADLKYAHPLVRIVRAAWEFPDTPDRLPQLALQPLLGSYGLGAQDYADLIVEANDAVTEMEASLGLKPDAGEAADAGSSGVALAHLVRNHAVVSALFSSEGAVERSATWPDFAKQVHAAVRLLYGDGFVVLFWTDESGEVLRPCSQSSDPFLRDLQVELLDGAEHPSALVAAFRAAAGEVVRIETGAAGQALIDEQLLRYSGSGSLLCLPVQTEGAARGVLAVSGAGLNLAEARLASSVFQLLLSQLARQAPGESCTMDRAEQRLRQTEERTSRWIRETVHEVSNPLSIIQNYVQILSMRMSDDPQIRENLDVIRDEVNRIGSLLDRLGRAPVAELSRQRRPTNVNELLRGLVNFFQDSIFVSKQIKCRLELAPQLPDIESDASILKQIFNNLIRNAVEALPMSGEICVRTHDRVILDDHTYIETVIEDNGPGIPEHVMSQLFSPVVSQKGAGHAGIGLSIVKKLVHELGGTLRLRSDSQGTAWSIYLPREVLETL